MAKIIVKTTGSFGIIGPNGDYVPADRPACVADSSVMREKYSEGYLVILARDLPDTANAIDFLDVYLEAEGDVELAVDSYVSILKHRADKA